jgi:hypothetical protein
MPLPELAEFLQPKAPLFQKLLLNTLWRPVPLMYQIVPIIFQGAGLARRNAAGPMPVTALKARVKW